VADVEVGVQDLKFKIEGSKFFVREAILMLSLFENDLSFLAFA
jgi:hypothetical protein